MSVRLRDEDRRAVDLLLDRAASGQGVRPPAAGNGHGLGNGNGNGQMHATGFSPVSGDVQAGLPGVQKVLQVLDMLPAEEPPADLLARTLNRLDAELAGHPSALRAPQPAAGGVMQQPHA
jgi:hypothetical protein